MRRCGVKNGASQIPFTLARVKLINLKDIVGPRARRMILRLADVEDVPNMRKWLTFNGPAIETKSCQSEKISAWKKI